MYLAENIKYLREKEGMTQEAFANAIGDINQKTVSHWEKKSREPELKRIIKIAEFFSVTLDDLILHKLKPPTPLYVSNMRFLRKQQGMNQEDIASLLKVKQSTVALYESGKRGMDLEQLCMISDFFGVSMDRLVKEDLSQGGA